MPRGRDRRNDPDNDLTREAFAARWQRLGMVSRNPDYEESEDDPGIWRKKSVSNYADTGVYHGPVQPASTIGSGPLVGTQDPEFYKVLDDEAEYHYRRSGR